MLLIQIKKHFYFGLEIMLHMMFGNKEENIIFKILEELQKFLKKLIWV